jgi:hypothetical protein
MSYQKSIIVDNWVVSRGENYVAHRTANERDYANLNTFSVGSSRDDEKVRLELAGKTAVKFFDHITNGGEIEIKKNKVIMK